MFFPMFVRFIKAYKVRKEWTGAVEELLFTPQLFPSNSKWSRRTSRRSNRRS